MSDQFPLDGNSAKADFEVSPESGSGLEAANFRAKPPEQFLGGGGSPEIKPQPETPRSPTEGSKGFLGKMAHGAREAGIAMVAAITPGGPIALAFRRERLEAERAQPKVGVEKPTPTKKSDSFFKYYFKKELVPIANNATKFPAALITEIAGLQAIATLGGLGIESDIAEGRWGKAAAKGVIAGIMVTPLVRLVKNVLKTDE